MRCTWWVAERGGVRRWRVSLRSGPPGTGGSLLCEAHLKAYHGLTPRVPFAPPLLLGSASSATTYRLVANSSVLNGSSWSVAPPGPRLASSFFPHSEAEKDRMERWGHRVELESDPEGSSRERPFSLYLPKPYTVEIRENTLGSENVS